MFKEDFFFNADHVGHGSVGAHRFGLACESMYMLSISWGAVGRMSMEGAGRGEVKRCHSRELPQDLVLRESAYCVAM